MPNKTVDYLLNEFKQMKTALEKHLEEGQGVKADIRWLKWAVMGMIGGIGSLLIFIIVALVNLLLKK